MEKKIKGASSQKLKSSFETVNDVNEIEESLSTVCDGIWSGTGKRISDASFYVSFCIDVVMMLAIGWRSLHIPYNMTLMHYASWVPISNVPALFLPEERRHWFNVFRFFSAFQYLQLTLWLAYAGLDGATFMTLIRLICISVALGHSLLLWYQNGPWGFNDFQELLSYLHKIYTRSTPIQTVSFAPFLVGLIVLFSGQTAYNTHWNYGEQGIDAALSSLQGGNGVAIMMKYGIMQLLVFDCAKRSRAALIVFTLFISQWFTMLPMFQNAPLPYAHIGVEFLFLADAAVSFFFPVK